MSAQGTKEAIEHNISTRCHSNPAQARVIGRLAWEERRTWIIKAHVMYRDIGLKSREERIRFFHIFLGYPIRSTDDLTVAQVNAFNVAFRTFPDDTREMVQELLREYATG